MGSERIAPPRTAATVFVTEWLGFIRREPEQFLERKKSKAGLCRGESTITENKEEGNQGLVGAEIFCIDPNHETLRSATGTGHMASEVQRAF